jgi:hypothetical protein
VYESSGTIYAGTAGGLSITTNGGLTFTNYTITEGLANNRVFSVYESGGTVYAGTFGGGLSIGT